MQNKRRSNSLRKPKVQKWIAGNTVQDILNIIDGDYINIKETYVKGYYVSDDGHVFSNKIPGGKGTQNQSYLHELAYKIDKYGYKVVCLSQLINGEQKRKYITVHRLVYLTFIGDIPEGYHVDHLDKNRLNNKLSNLRLLTCYENSNMYRNGINLYKVIDHNLGGKEFQLYKKELQEKYQLSEATLYKQVTSGERSSDYFKKKGVDISIYRV